MTYGFCVYHGIECDYKGYCIDCPHNTEEDVEWFRQDEERAESEDNGIMDNVVGLYRGHGNVIEVPKKATNKELLKWLFPQYEIILEKGDTYTILLQPYHALSPKIIVFKSWLEESYND